MSTPADPLESLRAISARARMLDERLTRLMGDEARIRVIFIQLEGALAPIVRSLDLDDQIRVGAPMAAIRSLLLGVQPRRVGVVGRLHVVRDPE